MEWIKKHIEDINFGMFIFYIISYLIIVVFFEKNDFIFDLKHYILAFAFFVSTVCLIIKYGKDFYKKKFYCPSCINVAWVGLLFIVVSLFCALKVGYAINFRTIVQTMLFVLPTLYAFNLINLISSEKLIKMLKITTFIFIFTYFTESRHTIFDFLNLENWLNINYATSTSFTESHICAESFLQLFLFFFYLKNCSEGGSNIKNIKLYVILNFIFTMLSFKRLGMLFALFIVVFNFFIDYKKRIKLKKNIILTVIFVIITILYAELLKGNISLDAIGIDINKLTTNRFYILSLWRDKNYLSYGYGTSLLVIGRYLEMDLLQIYLELGVLCLFVFIYFYFAIANKRVYSNLIVIYVMFNLLTSSTMPWTSGWVLFILTLTSVSSNKFLIIESKEDNKDLVKVGETLSVRLRMLKKTST